MGRTSKLEQAAEDPVRDANEEYIEPVTAVLADGGSWREAARRTGVSARSLRRWRDMGEERPEDDIHHEYAVAVRRARGEGEGLYREALMAIAMETSDAPTLLAMLKRRYPDAWGHLDRPRTLSP